MSSPHALRPSMFLDIYIYVVGTFGVHFARDRMCTLDEPSQLLTP